VTLNGGTLQLASATTTAISNSVVVNTTGGTIDANGGSLTLQSTISNGNGTTGLLNVTDSFGFFGTVVFQGTNTYSGGTLVNGTAVLQVNNSNAVGTGTVTLDNGTFQSDGSTNLTLANNFKLNTGGGTIDNNGKTLTITGNISDGNG